MTSGKEYRAKAAEFAQKAKEEVDEKACLELESLAKAYRRLAMQAELNEELGFVPRARAKTTKPDDEPIA